jgi:hypothetical protein
MSVYKKLQQARLNIVQTAMKKSGKNRFANYDYFELGDFLPTVHSVFNDVGLCGVFTLSDTNAHLTIHDTDSDGVISFSSPLVMAEGSKQQAIQLLGSTHSYLRRYLWLMALELVESDGVDSLAPIVKKPQLENLTVESYKALERVLERPTPIIQPQAVSDAVTSDEVPFDVDNLTVIHDWMIEFGKNCDSYASLVKFWNQHKSHLEDMKKHTPVLYEETVAKFKIFKETLKGKEDGK